MIGIDEVGRGAWAGPLLVVGAAIEDEVSPEELTDSKLLTTESRQTILPVIKRALVGVEAVWVTPSYIDKNGLSQSLKVACQTIFSSLSYLNLSTIIDGNINYLKGESGVEAIVKADQSVPAVSAASVLAKELRDGYMRRIARVYPGYSFESNVGYGTTIHAEALKALGPSPIHRLSYKPVHASIKQQSKRS